MITDPDDYIESLLEQGFVDNRERPVETFPFDHESYEFGNGWTAKREVGTLTPNGNDTNGRWVLRDNEGVVRDFDTYRHDMFERHGLDAHSLDCIKLSY